MQTPSQKPRCSSSAVETLLPPIAPNLPSARPVRPLRARGCLPNEESQGLLCKPAQCRWPGGAGGSQVPTSLLQAKLHVATQTGPALTAATGSLGAIPMARPAEAAPPKSRAAGLLGAIHWHPSRTRLTLRIWRWCVHQSPLLSLSMHGEADCKWQQYVRIGGQKIRQI